MMKIFPVRLSNSSNVFLISTQRKQPKQKAKIDTPWKFFFFFFFAGWGVTLIFKSLGLI